MTDKTANIILWVSLVLLTASNCSAIDWCYEYVDKKQYDLAIEACTERILKENPQAVDYYNRGTAYLNRQAYKMAIEDFNKANELNPDFPALYYNRGNAYKNIGNNVQALLDYDKAVRIGGNDPLAFYNRAVYHAKLSCVYDWNRG